MSAADYENRGLSVWYLQEHLCGDLQTPDNCTIHNLKPKILESGKAVICPRDGKPGAAYVDATRTADRCAGHATHMLSYTWQYNIGTIISALTSFCARHRLRRENTVAWMCCFCVNQWRVEERTEVQQAVDFETFRETFQNRVEQIGKVVSLLWPWDSPLNLKRLWCVFEIHTAINQKGCELHILLPDSQWKAMETCLCGEPDKPHEGSITGMAALNAAYSNIKMENAQASFPEDRKFILNIVAPGIDEDNKSALTEACAKGNGRITTKLQDWFIDEAQKIRQDMPVRAQLPIGWMLVTQGKFDEALRLYDDAVKHVEARSHDAGKIWFERGQCYRRKADHTHALRCYVHAQNIFEHTGSQESLDAACNLMGLGITLDLMKKHDDALKVYTHMLSAFEATNPRCADYCNGLKHMGNCYLNMGNVQDAVEMFARSYENFKELGSTANVWCLDALTSIGKAHVDLHNFEAAEQWFAEAESQFEALGCKTCAQYGALLKAKTSLEFEREYANLIGKESKARAPFDCPEMPQVGSPPAQRGPVNMNKFIVSAQVMIQDRHWQRRRRQTVSNVPDDSADLLILRTKSAPAVSSEDLNPPTLQRLISEQSECSMSGKVSKDRIFKICAHETTSAKPCASSCGFQAAPNCSYCCRSCSMQPRSHDAQCQMIRMQEQDFRVLLKESLKAFLPQRDGKVSVGILCSFLRSIPTFKEADLTNICKLVPVDSDGNCSADELVDWLYS